MKLTVEYIFIQNMFRGINLILVFYKSNPIQKSLTLKNNEMCFIFYEGILFGGWRLRLTCVSVFCLYTDVPTLICSCLDCVGNHTNRASRRGVAFVVLPPVHHQQPCDEKRKETRLRPHLPLPSLPPSSRSSIRPIDRDR